MSSTRMTDERDSRSSQPVPPILPNPPAVATPAPVSSTVDLAPVADSRLPQQAGKRPRCRQQFRCRDASLRVEYLRYRPFHPRHPGPSLSPESGAVWLEVFHSLRHGTRSPATSARCPLSMALLPPRFSPCCMAVPLALGVAIFLTELCPRPLRAPISFLTELLAAIPSVVYGLWARLRPGPTHARCPRPISC